MIKRRVQRRSDVGMHFLLYPGRDQVEIRQGANSFTNAATQGQAFLLFASRFLAISIVNSVLSEEKTLGDMSAVFGAVVMRPPVTPGARIFSN